VDFGWILRDFGWILSDIVGSTVASKESKENQTVIELLIRA